MDDNAGMPHATYPWKSLSLHGEMVSKETAEYQKGKPFHRCGLCMYYRAHKCDIVRGYIAPMMGCKYFAKKHTDALYPAHEEPDGDEDDAA